MALSMQWFNHSFFMIMQNDVKTYNLVFFLKRLCCHLELNDGKPMISRIMKSDNRAQGNDI